MVHLLTRLMIGFGAGVSSHLFIEGLVGVGLYTFGLYPKLPWSLSPVGPFDIPQSMSFAFWAGLFGILYALCEPTLTGLAGRWLGGFGYGVLVPLFVEWIVVLPLKADSFLNRLPMQNLVVDVSLNASLGIGAVLLFQAYVGPARTIPSSGKGTSR